MKQRILSALVLLPLTFVAIWFSHPWVEILLSIIVALLAWEWDNMFSKKQTPFALANTATAIMAMLMLKDIVTFNICAIFIAILALWEYKKAPKYKIARPRLFPFGVVYITAFAVSALLLLNNLGTLFVLWVILVVFATDIGGMVIGLPLRGPALCSRISPKKTWSGFFGGLLFAGIVAITFGILFNLGPVLNLVLFGETIAVLSVFGDLIESKIKRVVEVKDSSDLIPGHGGVFDRIDSVMFVFIMLAAGDIVYIIGLIKCPQLVF